jgi:hypothetical protein
MSYVALKLVLNVTEEYGVKRTFPIRMKKLRSSGKEDPSRPAKADRPLTLDRGNAGKVQRFHQASNAPLPLGAAECSRGRQSAVGR